MTAGPWELMGDLYSVTSIWIHRITQTSQAVDENCIGKLFIYVMIL